MLIASFSSILRIVAQIKHKSACPFPFIWFSTSVILRFKFPDFLFKMQYLFSSMNIIMIPGSKGHDFHACMKIMTLGPAKHENQPMSTAFFFSHILKISKIS